MLSLRNFLIVIIMAMVLEILLSMQPDHGYAQQDILKVVKISSEADSAVVRNGKGRLQVIRTGDRIMPYGQVLAIFKNRIALKNEKAETIFINIENGKQTIQRVGKINKADTVMRTQISTTGDQQNGRRKSGVEKDAREKPHK